MMKLCNVLYQICRFQASGWDFSPKKRIAIEGTSKGEDKEIEIDKAK